MVVVRFICQNLAISLATIDRHRTRQRESSSPLKLHNISLFVQPLLDVCISVWINMLTRAGLGAAAGLAGD